MHTWLIGNPNKAISASAHACLSPYCGSLKLFLFPLFLLGLSSNARPSSWLVPPARIRLAALGCATGGNPIPACSRLAAGRCHLSGDHHCRLVRPRQVKLEKFSRSLARSFARSLAPSALPYS